MVKKKYPIVVEYTSKGRKMTCVQTSEIAGYVCEELDEPIEG